MIPQNRGKTISNILNWWLHVKYYLMIICNYIFYLLQNIRNFHFRRNGDQCTSINNGDTELKTLTRGLLAVYPTFGNMKLMDIIERVTGRFITGSFFITFGDKSRCSRINGTLNNIFFFSSLVPASYQSFMFFVTRYISTRKWRRVAMEWILD